VEGVGNVNGDYYDDFAVGALEYGSGDGAVDLMFGDANDWLGSFNLSEASVKFFGDSNDEAGTDIAGGDLNGDGYSDIVISSPGWESDRGGVFVFYGF
jgi:hypothetical protein